MLQPHPYLLPLPPLPPSQRKSHAYDRYAASDGVSLVVLIRRWSRKHTIKCTHTESKSSLGTAVNFGRRICGWAVAVERYGPVDFAISVGTSMANLLRHYSRKRKENGNFERMTRIFPTYREYLDVLLNEYGRTTAHYHFTHQHLHSLSS